MKKGFASRHPLMQTVFFISCISVTMFIMHPCFLLISFVISAVSVFMTCGGKKLLSALKLDLVSSALIMLINPLISHAGVTALAYFPDGNPLTLESIIFGAAAALLMSSAVNWFFCVSVIMTSDRIIYLFGRIAPGLALLISMTLSFVGKLSAHYKSIRAVQLVNGEKKSGLLYRLRASVRMISSLIQWALENSVDTADSMKSRGYGTGRRTSYHNFRIRTADVILTVFFLLTDAVIIAANASELIWFSYYPITSVSVDSLQAAGVFVLFGLMCLVPAADDIREAVKWKHISSGI